MEVTRSCALAICYDIFQISFLQFAYRLREAQKEHEYFSQSQSMDLPDFGDIFVQRPGMQQEDGGLRRLQQVWGVRTRMESIMYEMREILFLLSILEDLRDL